MAGKAKFDPEAAFRSIIRPVKENEAAKAEPPEIKGRQESDLSSAGPISADEDASPAGLRAAGGREEAKEEAPASRGRPKSDKETKKRVSLAVYPGVYRDLQRIAYVDRTSVSGIVTRLISDYVAKNVWKLEEYEKIKGNNGNKLYNRNNGRTII